MKLSQLFLIGSNVPIFIVIIFALITRKNFGKAYKPFLKFLYLSGSVQLISLPLWFFQLNNISLLHFYVPISTVLLVNFYKQFLGNFISAKIFNGAAILFVTLSVLNTIFLQDILTFNSYALTVQSILISILSLSTFKWLMHEDIRKKYKKNKLSSLNWINSGLFIYYSSNLIIFYFGELMMHSISKEWSQQTWILHNTFSTVMYFCFFVGIWKNRQQ